MAISASRADGRRVAVSQTGQGTLCLCIPFCRTIASIADGGRGLVRRSSGILYPLRSLIRQAGVASQVLSVLCSITAVRSSGTEGRVPT